MKAGEWILRSQRVATPSGLRPADVAIREEMIAEVLPYDGPESEGVILDAGDLVVLPGLVALHRGTAERSDRAWFEAATRDAGAGGVTTLIDLSPSPGSVPVEPMAGFRRMAAAGGRIQVDCGLVVPLGRGQSGRLGSWIEEGFLGVEASLGDVGVTLGSDLTEADLRTAMPILADLGRPLIVDSRRIGRNSALPDELDRSASSWSELEFSVIHLIIQLCRETRCRVHLMIGPGASQVLPMLAEAHAEGLPLTVETGPRHHWDALESGLIGSIGPDPDLRDLGFSVSPAGEVALSSTEAGPLLLALPAAWAEASRRGFAIDQIGRWMAGQPARVMGLDGRKGAIASGLDADLVVFDPDAQWSADLHSSKLEAHPLLGRVEATILRGTLIYQGGEFVERPRGSVVLRLEETLPISGTDA